ncbi:hypothetical protein CMQ_6863 [Grosmannia clavigera kw1407]|uniref:Uncharacterized protein n=1 Tax=Grosmannia clavigera (strain kw1407 / UAMH 11150) TaxID=655863 RepID=F0X6Y0_GROCL|nr:uncharacterized protein CMQ_6863 [Grosmannia clavigera kw1407]EFX06542.1 hypothetical protein CMQ_6863 [Grosmannia clavigera kw1407]
MTPMAIREEIVPGGDVVLQLQRLVPAPIATADEEADIVPPASPATTVATMVEDGAAIGSPPDSPLAVPHKSAKTAQTVQTVELVVSSNTLRMVSSVFDTLLKPLQQQRDPITPAATPTAITNIPTPPASPTVRRKKKGSLNNDTAAAAIPTPPLQVLDPLTAVAPFVLALPEDDAAAMELLMRLVHFRLGDIYTPGGDGVHSGLPGPRLLEQLAYVCDKYRCAGAIQGVSDSWIRENMERLASAMEHETSKTFKVDRADRVEKGPKADQAADATQASQILDGYCRLVVFAYVADQPRVFSDLCWHLVLHHGGPMTTNLQAGACFSAVPTMPDVSTPANILADHPLLAQSVAVLLESRRLASCSRFHTALTEPLRFDWKGTGDQPLCTVGREAMGVYIKTITEAGLLTHDLVYSGLSVQQLLDGIDRLPPIRPCDYPIKDSCFGHSGSGFDLDLVASLRTGKDSILGCRDSYTCLDCIRTGGQSQQKRRCRVNHS